MRQFFLSHFHFFCEITRVYKVKRKTTEKIKNRFFCLLFYFYNFFLCSTGFFSHRKKEHKHTRMQTKSSQPIAHSGSLRFFPPLFSTHSDIKSNHSERESESFRTEEKKKKKNMIKYSTNIFRTQKSREERERKGEAEPRE